MAQFIFKACETTKSHPDVTKYDVVLPDYLRLLALALPRPLEISKIYLTVHKVSDTIFRVRSQIDLDKLLDLQITTQDDDICGQKCSVRRIYNYGTIVESWQVILGQQVLPKGEFGRLGKLKGYTRQQSQVDDYMALTTGCFILALLEQEREERDDKEAMVEAVEEDEDWELV